jgi:hypothetical protein
MQAYSGGMSITGTPGGSPAKMGMSVADVGAGLFATVGVLMALQVRHATGKGQRVDASLLEGQMAMLTQFFTRYYASGEVPGPSGSGALSSPTYRAFQGSDDWIVIAAFNQRMWRGHVLRQPAPAGGGLAGGKAAVGKGVHCQPRQNQGRNQGSRPGDGGERELGCNYGPYQQKPGIGDSRRTGIADQGHRFAVTNHPHNPVAHATLVVFVHGNQRFANVVVLEQDMGLAGVFTGDDIDRTQNLEGPHGDIA